MRGFWLTGDHFAGKLSSMGQPTKPTQPSVPLGSVKHVITWITGLQTIKRQTRAAFGCLVAGQNMWAQAWLIGCTPALSVTQKRSCSCGMRLVALCKCCMPLRFPIDCYSYTCSICRPIYLHFTSL